MSTATEVLLSDIHEVFRCCACRHAPLQPPAYSCRLGHAVCAACRDRINNQCNECGESLSGRNLPLEEVLLTALYNQQQDLITLEEEEEGEGSLLSRRAATLERLGKVVAEDCQVQMLAGGRTVQCPFPCGARVTAPGLYRHFGFQHPEVLVGMLYKNQPCNITIPSHHIAGLDQQSPTRCVYIFFVDIGDGGPREEDKLMALNSMNAAELLNITHNMRYMLRRHQYLAMLTVGRHSQTEAMEAWVTALYDFSPVRYTLRFSCETSCLTYQGRPKSLHVPVDQRGESLVLPSALVSSNCDSEGLDLTVVFHLDLPFPDGYSPSPSPDSHPLETEQETILCDV